MDLSETYTHFNTVEECDQFVLTLPRTLGRCCGGKGVRLRKLALHTVLNNPKQYPVQPPVTKHQVTKHTEDSICCVCYEECIDLTSCGHLLCTSCLPLVRPLCPYCRQTL
jgi:hypothetical protein